jgi:HEAT repeat protein
VASAAPVSAARGRIARFAEPLLDDADQRTREAAVAVLGEIGDARSISALEGFRRREPMPRHQAAAEKAIERIRSRSDAPGAGPNALEARLEAVEERLEAAEKALEAADDRH